METQAIPENEISEETKKLGRILNSTIECFYEDKQNLDKYKKSTEEYNTEIKELMAKLNTDIFYTDSGLQAKISVQHRESFIEEALLNKIKTLKIPGVIKTKEYVDMDALEDAIYNEVLDASELSSCRTSKEVITLKVSKKKVK